MHPDLLNNLPQLYAVYSPVTGFSGNTSSLVDEFAELDEETVMKVQKYIDDRVEYAKKRAERDGEP